MLLVIFDLSLCVTRLSKLSMLFLPSWLIHFYLLLRWRLGNFRTKLTWVSTLPRYKFTHCKHLIHIRLNPLAQCSARTLSQIHVRILVSDCFLVADWLGFLCWSCLIDSKNSLPFMRSSSSSMKVRGPALAHKCAPASLMTQVTFTSDNPHHLPIRYPYLQDEWWAPDRGSWK